MNSLELLVAGELREKRLRNIVGFWRIFVGSLVNFSGFVGLS